MKKEMVVLGLMMVLVLPLVSASLSSNMDEVQTYISQYEAGILNTPQLVVYVEYIQNKMYEELDKSGQRAFTEAEIAGVFDKKQENEYEKWLEQYEKRFMTDDFHIVFHAYSFYRHDKAFYEQREEDSEVYYTIHYEIEPGRGVSDIEDVEIQIINFISDLTSLADSDIDGKEFEDLREKLTDIKSTMWQIEDEERCGEILSGAGLTAHETSSYSVKEEMKMSGDGLIVYEASSYSETSSYSYSYLIKESKQENCRSEPKCEQVCGVVEKCPEDCVPNCYTEEICEGQICEDVFNNETNSTEQVCEDVCYDKEFCEGCECWEEPKCEQVCEAHEQCDESVEAELKVEGRCGKSGDFFVTAWGPGFDPYQELNDDYGRWDCGGDLDGLVALRKAFQTGVNSGFAEWYFEEFLAGTDYDKILNGDEGFKKVLRILTRNEEDISGILQCDQQEWPSDFEKIDITYINENTHLEIWEKMISVEGAPTKYYTTLYKYSWVPDKELLKGLIDYELSETDTIGPSAADVARIKQNQGQMDLINSLSERYGGSFDIGLELIENKSSVIRKYLRVNPEVAVKIVDELGEGEKPDISIEVDYAVLYDFISYMSYEMEGDKIYGPHWVRVEGEGGPGEFFSVVGAVSKMWREGVTIKPRYALLKLLFNSKNLAVLFGGATVSSVQIAPARVGPSSGVYQGGVINVKQEEIIVKEG